MLVHYGGGSAVRSGLLDKICGILKEGGIEAVLLGGVVPNPRLSKVHEGIDLCRREGVDFILSIGGGSVIDSAKAIACGVLYDGEVWDFYEGKADAATDIHAPRGSSRSSVPMTCAASTVWPPAARPSALA